MHLPFFIAKRYLFAKKSHNVINIISLISAVGIGIGSMALIIILSVYNGFDTLVKSFYQEYQPDFIITPSTGKSFSSGSAGFCEIGSWPAVAHLSPVVEETVFALYDNRQAIVSMKGIDTSYGRISRIENNVVEGEFKTGFGTTPNVILGRQLATSLRLRVRFIEPFELYFPDRNTNISLLNPMAGLNNETLYPSGIISLNQEFDQNGIFVPISTARKLLSYSDDEVTSCEIYLASGASQSDIEKKLEQTLGNAFVVKNRYEQNDTLYKMMRAEKFAVYLILFFVILIISVNIFGSLSMLLIDKKMDMQTYRSMGATDKQIESIFVLQGWLISVSGAVVGIITGLVLCFVQQKWGIISMPGNYIIDSYPVHVQFWDVAITFAGVVSIGYLIALLPMKYLK